MANIEATSEAVIAASPEAIYAILVDYEDKHQRILPPEHFNSFKIEAGGHGAGTIISFHTRAAGSERAWHMTVTEPQPGRMLTESDSFSDTITSFILTPVGDSTRVQIATTWSAKGLRGLLERWLAPSALRPIYEKELARLADVVREQR